MSISSADAPDKLTLHLVSVIAGVTLISWVAAKAGCNDREMPVRFPNPLTQVQGRQTAKSAAIEFGQALATRHWSAAAAFAGDSVKPQIAAWEADCQKNQAPCSPIASVFTRATVWERKGRKETLEVTSQGPFGERRWQVEAARQADGWSVVQVEEGPRSPGKPPGAGEAEQATGAEPPGPPAAPPVSSPSSNQ